MELVEKQIKFTQNVSLLIQYAICIGYQVVIADAARMDRRGHKKKSKHYEKLAIDLDVFRENKPLESPEHSFKLGLFWESLEHVWGGRFKTESYNHFEF